MDYFDKELVNNVNKLGKEIFNDECEIVPLDIFGKLLKKVLMKEDIYFNINKKSISRSCIKQYYKNLSYFIINKTEYINKKDGISCIVFSEHFYPIKQ